MTKTARTNRFSKEFLDDIELNDLNTAISKLTAAFVWDKSPQGHDYWAQISNALYQIRYAKEAHK